MSQMNLFSYVPCFLMSWKYLRISLSEGLSSDESKRRISRQIIKGLSAPIND